MVVATKTMVVVVATVEEKTVDTTAVRILEAVVVAAAETSSTVGVIVVVIVATKEDSISSSQGMAEETPLINSMEASWKTLGMATTVLVEVATWMMGRISEARCNSASTLIMTIRLSSIVRVSASLAKMLQQPPNTSNNSITSSNSKCC